jgi:hypothetical protein
MDIVNGKEQKLNYHYGIDIGNLIVKYMKHIGDLEGTDFVDCLNDPTVEVEFNNTEKSLLEFYSLTARGKI